MKKLTEKKDCKEEDQAHIIFNGELPTIEQLTQLLMTEAMKRANGNKSIAAEMLGISL
jgi:DNA-binding protein Fis